MISDLPFTIQSTVTIKTTTASFEETCQARPRIMTHSHKPTQRIRIRGVDGARGGRLLSESANRAAISGHQRSSPNRCGLFSGSAMEIKAIDLPTIDLDDEAFLTSFKPKLEPQLSVLSTDSGILPRDIRNSSFVDDVIGELTSRGIFHSDIISGGETGQTTAVAATAEACPGQLRKRKASSPLPPPFAVSPDSIGDYDSNYSPVSSSCQQQGTCGSGFGTDEIKRIKNNEASRKSRASRKQKSIFKEQEIANLEEENLRLSLLLKDFSDVAATCKRWLVQRMENPTED